MQFTHAMSIKNDARHRDADKIVRVIRHIAPAPTPTDHFATKTTGFTILVSRTPSFSPASVHDYTPIPNQPIPEQPPSWPPQPPAPETYDVTTEAEVINHLLIERVSMFDGWEIVP